MAPLKDVLVLLKETCAMNGLLLCEVTDAVFSLDKIYDNVGASGKELPCVTGYRMNLTCELNCLPEIKPMEE